MTIPEGDKKWEGLDGRIDKEFSCDTLVAWVREVTEEGRIPLDQKGDENLRRITGHGDFRMIMAQVMEIDTTVRQPSTGQRVEILHGSFFYPEDLLLLEDHTLNVALEKYKDYIDWRGIGRSHFADTLRWASVLLGSMVIPHSLTHDEIVEIAKRHCLVSLIWLPEAGDRVETAVLLYAGMKIIANKLESAETLRILSNFPSKISSRLCQDFLRRWSVTRSWAKL